MHRLQEFDQAQIKTKLPHFKSGDTVRVHCKIKEGNKERIQIFEGVVISRHNAGISSSFTVRKISHGIGVERVFPLHAPFVEKIEVNTIGKVRQSRIYYLRELSGKKARIAAVDTRKLNKKSATEQATGEVESAQEAASAVKEEVAAEATAGAQEAESAAAASDEQPENSKE